MSDVWMLVLVALLFGSLVLLVKLCDAVRTR
jgi:hypothetical protein